MAITTSDIEKKTFSTALRGYDLDEVDDFLDEMVVAVRELQDELARAKARVAELERDPDAPQAAVLGTIAPDESAVGRALVAAQQAADRMLEDARGEADKIVGDARSEADTFARDRDRRRAEVEAEMVEMTGLVAGVRNQLAVLATTVADKLDEMDAAVAGAHGESATSVAGEDTLEPGTVSDDEEVEPPGEDLAESDIDAAVNEMVEASGADETGDDVDAAAGFELDLEDLGSSEEADQAGSTEIEGVEVLEEEEEL